MFSHPGDLESVQDQDRTDQEHSAVDEDFGLALDASRSFVTRKNRLNNEQEVNITYDPSTVQVTDVELGLLYCSPKFPGEYVRPHSGDTEDNIVIPASPRTPFHRKNKVHLSWKARIADPLQETKISQYMSEGHLSNRTHRTNEERMRTEEVDAEIDIFQKENLKGRHNIRKERIKEFAESAVVNIVVGIFTLFALLSSNIGSLIDSRTVDLVLDIIAICSFFVFAAEMIIALYVEDHYKWSMFFWLDLFSTLSISIHIEFLLEDFFPEIVHKSAGLAEVSRASRLVTREGNILRLLQVFQLGRLYKHVRRNQTLTEMNHRKEALQKGFTRKALEAKWSLLYHKAQLSKKKQQSVGTLEKVKSVIMDSFGKVPSGHVEQTLNHLDNEQKDIITKEAEKTAAKYRKEKKVRFSGEIEEAEAVFKDVEEENIKETKIARKLADYTMKQIVIVVMLLLLVLPLLNISFYFDPLESQEYQIKFLQRIIDDTTITEQAKEQAVQSFIESQSTHDPHLVFLRIGDKIIFADPNVELNHLKHSQSEVISGMTNLRGEIYCVMSFHADEKIEAILEMLNTVFICFVLTVSAFLLNRDAQRLVLKPLEKIIHRVNKIVSNPASARDLQQPTNNLGFNTTALFVENAIGRMSELLAIGFGDAGSAVITQSFMMTGDLNSALSGTKKVAIFGVCDIHDFMKTTEVLQEETLMFVNTIADIVHSMTDKYAGSVSQNMGDSFLLVWKFPEEVIVENAEGDLEIVVNQVTQNIADCSLIAFMKIYARINRDPTLLGYRKDARLNERMPNYKTNIGFGLHVGWAIEGAIGSEHKIDSYYLSPDINMTWRLEKGTRHYDVPFLFSGELHAMLSDKMKEECRLIDEVEIEGLGHPLKMYTIDMSTKGLGKAKDRRYSPIKEKRIRQKKKKEYINEVIQSGYAYTLLRTDKDLRRLLRNRVSEFQQLFKEGFKAYTDGNWKTAKEKFEECMMMKFDGPTNNLLSYMGQYGFEVPDGWESRKVNLKK